MKPMYKHIYKIHNVYVHRYAYIIVAICDVFIYHIKKIALHFIRTVSGNIIAWEIVINIASYLLFDLNNYVKFC